MKLAGRPLKWGLLGCLCVVSASVMASSIYLECSLTSTTTNTTSTDISTVERDGVLLEVLNDEGALEVRTQNFSIPIDIRVNGTKKEWRSGDAVVYDENTSTSRRYSLQRVVEDQISTTTVSFELDRSTGYLVQEMTQALGEAMTVINVTQGKCTPSKKSFNALF